MKTRKRGASKISRTLLEIYLDCPRKWYYYNHPDIPKKTDYKRLCGIAVHKHISQLYKPTSTARPLFYKDKKSAVGAWFNRWHRELDKARELNRIVLDAELTKEYGKIGAICVANYWNQNINLTRPTAVERLYETTLGIGVTLKGIVDQIRIAPLEWIARHRPDAVEKGKLKDEFDPAVAVDLKTDSRSFDFKKDGGEIPAAEKARRQYKLHENLQATLYCYLYEKATGKKPIGFLWYHLRSGKMFFTFRDERDYATLFGAIDHYRESISGESFPKHVNSQCDFCDYLEICRADRNFLVSRAEEFPENPAGVEIVPNLIRKNQYQQLRLRLKVERSKAQTTVQISPENKLEIAEKRILMLPDFPWDERRE